MIDLGLLRANPERIISLLKKKDPLYDAQLLWSLDSALKAVRVEIEALRHKKNELAEQGKKGVTPELRAQSIEIGNALKSKEESAKDLELRFKELYLRCPNIPQEDIPEGGKEANKVVKEVGKKPTFSFPIKNHVELGNALDWFDFDAAATMTGSNFALYKGDAVKLLYALTMFMLKHNIKHGYQPIVPPYIVNGKSLEVASNFPKFKDQVYHLQDEHLYLTPTSEVNLTNMYREHILPDEQLPIRMTSWTSCFRREAGTYGAAERGLIRIHQFEKVELYTISKPEESAAELQKMLTCAQELLQKLGLHYRVSLLAMQDCSFPSARTYDIEVWMPGQNAFYEVSSVSNCTDFQARRGLIRYKKSAESRPELVHTLNGSSLALPRLMVAIMETFQQANGSITIPDILKNEGIF